MAENTSRKETRMKKSKPKDVSALLLVIAILSLLVGLPSVHLATGGQYAKLLDPDWYLEDVLRAPARRGERRFERRVESRMRELGEDRPTAEKKVVEYYQTPD